MFHQIAHGQCIVIKIGSSLLVDSHMGRMCREWLATLLDEITVFWEKGKEIIVVSSGAIALKSKEKGVKCNHRSC